MGTGTRPEVGSPRSSTMVSSWPAVSAPRVWLRYHRSSTEAMETAMPSTEAASASASRARGRADGRGHRRSTRSERESRLRLSPRQGVPGPAVAVARFEVASHGLTGCLEVFPGGNRASVGEHSEEVAPTLLWRGHLVGDDPQMRAWL